jgi:hypothetical protein
VHSNGHLSYHELLDGFQLGLWLQPTQDFTTEVTEKNPELTCQHADAETLLPAGGRATLHVKTFVFKGTLEQLLEKVKQERQRRTN